ncbi:L,D-transpeptidase [Helicobacter sp. MIT 05-5294]|uniref:L,D-transpeptidase n=1 Tax=Helicobacter sp. MIT 05-5294 TaxID=1548150 RepID=UPI001EE7D0A5|nr:L,D-transpeptidase [Helicobacter sp. MIT 05-5294]
MKKYFAIIAVVLLTSVGVMIFYDKPTQIPKSKQNQQNAQITHIVVEKSKRILSLYAKDEVIKTYPIALGESYRT